MDEVGERVASGSPLHTSITDAAGDMFPQHWVAMIATGEATGKLDEVLCDLNRQIREAAETRSKFVGAMIYPCVLIFVAILVVIVMLWFVVPTFGDMFKEMGAKLPDITLFVLDASDFLAAYGLYIFGWTWRWRIFAATLAQDRSMVNAVRSASWWRFPSSAIW